MDDVHLFLLAIASIFLIGALGEIIFQRTNVPDVIWLILAGILLGPVSGLLTREMLGRIAPYFAALTLVIVLFDGGSKLKLGELSTAAPRSGLLAVLAFGLAVAVVGPFSMMLAFVGIFPETWTWMHGWMLGAIVGGSSSIIIMPAMAQAKLAPKLANLVNLESALTDAFCVVTTAALIDVMIQGTEGAAGPAMTLLRSFGIGLAVGGVAGVVWILFLRILRSSEHAYPVTISGLLVLYVVIDNMGGSAALGIIAIAVILGNAESISHRMGLKEAVELGTDVRGFHRQMTFIIKSFFFVFIGAMLGPPWSLMLFGILLGGVLFLARVPAVSLSTIGAGFTRHERQMTVVSMPRGMAAGVLATLPVSAGIPGTDDLPVVVFACVLTSILIFAGGFPLVRGRMAATLTAEASLPLPGTPPAVEAQAEAAAETEATSVSVEDPGSMETEDRAGDSATDEPEPERS